LAKGYYKESGYSSTWKKGAGGNFVIENRIANSEREKGEPEEQRRDQKIENKIQTRKQDNGQETTEN
jgi:hypothetical protein